MTNNTISLDLLATVTGGLATTALSHADQLRLGNGGIAPRLPLSHADQLRLGNGGIAPKSTSGAASTRVGGLILM